MSHNQILDGAVFVGDVHFNTNRQEFLNLLDTLEMLGVKQLFLVGDIFDYINEYSVFFNRLNDIAIQKLNKLSQKIEIFYFEGNHDYGIGKIFPNIKVYPRNVQPVIFRIDTKKVAVSHGDIFISIKYDIFCSIIRNNFLLRILNILDIGFWLSQKIQNNLINKVICKDYPSFEEVIVNKMTKYSNLNVDYVIEGHYHQDCTFKINNTNYTNLPAFACNKSYLILNEGKFDKIKV